LKMKLVILLINIKIQDLYKTLRNDAK